MRARHRLSKLLLRHGIVYYGGGAWTGRPDAWLRGEALAQLTSHATRSAFDSDYETVLAAKARRERLDGVIEQMAADNTPITTNPFSLCRPTPSWPESAPIAETPLPKCRLPDRLSSVGSRWKGAS